MIIIDHAQGTEGWHAARKESDGTASELPVAAGKSKYQSRSDLLKAKFTGLTEEISASTQALFNKGHAAEEKARVLAEKIIGEDLYPVTGTLEIGGLKLLASLDGLTLSEEINYEHKLKNEKLLDAIRAVNAGTGELDEHYTKQMDQQMLVSGAVKTLFMCSDGTEDGMEWCWYYADQKKFDDVVSTWQQFHTDLAMYTLPVETVAPAAEAIMDLPAVIVQVKGELTLCNIADMRPVFDKFLSEAKTELITDNDFAQAEQESKVGRKAAKHCLATAKGVVDQTLTISEVTRELELYATKFNALALRQEKAVKEQKEARKLSIMTTAKVAFATHCAGLESEIKPIRLIIDMPNFPEAMKNKRLLSAIQDGVDAELARVKILADGVARGLRVNLQLLTENAAYKFLFNDFSQIVYKPFDDLKLLVSSRISFHEAAEAKKRETMRLAIEAEETKKAEERADKIIKDEADRVESLRLQKEREEEGMRRQDLKERQEADREKLDKYKIEQDRLDKVRAEEAEAKQLVDQAEIEIVRHQAAIKSVEKPLPVETHFRDESFEVLPHLIRPVESSINQYSGIHILGAVAKYLNLSQSETADILDSIDWQAVKEEINQAA